MRTAREKKIKRIITMENIDPRNQAKSDAGARDAAARREQAQVAAEKPERDRVIAAAKAAHDLEDKDWELPEGTTRATLPDGSTVYTLPDGTQRHVHLGQPNRYIFKSGLVGVNKLTVKELADKIRDHVDLHYSQKVHPDEQHLHATAVDVTKELGMEPNALNVNHVSGLINQHVTAPSREFPKMKYHHGRKTEQVVANAQEEADLGDGWHDRHWVAPAA
jgi:hypothetical protein